MKDHRLLVIEHHPQVRQALLTRLARVPGITVVGDTGEADEAVSLAITLQPDLILLEPKHLDSVRLVRQLRAALPDCEILIHTSYPDLWEKEALLRAGAGAYILKTLDLSALWQWLHQMTSPVAD